MAEENKEDKEFLLRSERLLRALERAQLNLTEQVEGNTVRANVDQLLRRFEGLDVRLEPLKDINLGLLRQDVTDIKTAMQKQEDRSWQIIALVIGEIIAVGGVIFLFFFKIQ